MITKISVIVPVYKVENTICRCVDSILGQTFTDFELLLIDDGSPDNSGAICDEYAAKDSRVRVFHKPNGGVSSARNLGLDNARGEWITFCDSDDYVFPSWLENFGLCEYSEDYDLICQGLETDRPLDNSIDALIYSTEFYGSIVECLDVLYGTKILGYPVIKLFKNSIIQAERLRFDTRLRVMEDEVFLLDYCIHCKRGMIVPGVGYYYFVPDWTRKYQICVEDVVLTYDILLNDIKRIDDCHVSKLYGEYLFRVIHNLYIGYRNTNKIEFIKELHRYLRIDFRNSRMALPTKMILYCDSTGYISKLWLDFIFRLKK